MANCNDLVQLVSGGGLSVREERCVRCSLVCRDGDDMWTWYELERLVARD